MSDRSKDIVRLNANENYYGCSPRVLEVIANNLKNVPVYPDFPLRLEQRLAEKFGVGNKNIVVGGGSVRVIDGIVQSLVKPDEEIISFERTFSAYEFLTKAHGRKYVIAPQTSFVCDPENILNLINAKTRVIFIANPNNPTGTIINHDQLETLLKEVPKNIVLVVDEAYCEYVSDHSYADSLSLQSDYSNLLILRTFSKIYGLAGLRIGYGIGDEKIVEKLQKNQIPFFFNCLSEDAALAALEDDSFVKECAAKNEIERSFLYDNLEKIGFETVPSHGNFIYVYFNDDAEKEKVFKRLIDKGLMICNMQVFGQDKSLRISVGDRSVNESILAAISAN